MTLAQGFAARKLLEAVGSEAITSVAAALASAPLPPPFNSSNPSLTAAALSAAPYDNSAPHASSSLRTNVVVVALFVGLFFATLLSIQIQRCYLRHNPGRAAATILPRYRPPLPPHGLDSSILETLPKAIFSSAMAVARQKAQTDCAICLEGFKDEQMLQILPRCGHGFHPECIRRWLLSHTTCPLCRHSLLIPLKPSSASSSSAEVAAYDSAGTGGVTLTLTLTDQHPSTPLPVQNSVVAAASIILVETEAAAANPNRNESKPSLQRMKLRRSHSTGHSPMKEESATYASSSLPPPPLQSFTVSDFHRCRSYTVLPNLGRRASQTSNQCYLSMPSSSQSYFSHDEHIILPH